MAYAALGLAYGILCLRSAWSDSSPDLEPVCDRPARAAFRCQRSGTCGDPCGLGCESISRGKQRFSANQDAMEGDVIKAVGPGSCRKRLLHRLPGLYLLHLV